MTVEIVSVHFPKAGGTSLRQSLVAAFGNEAVSFDYLDDPADPCSPYSLDPEGCRRKVRASAWGPVKVVHGHFHPSKYDGLDNVRRITFLRHPVDTMISIYFFWKTLNDGHCLFNYARQQQLGLLEVARLPALRYLQSRTYFGGFDTNRFAFIGFMESYADDLRHLSRLLSIPMVERKDNFNTYPGYQDEVAAVRSDRRLMARLQDCLIEDIRFYEAVQRKRTARLTA